MYTFTPPMSREHICLFVRAQSNKHVYVCVWMDGWVAECLSVWCFLSGAIARRPVGEGWGDSDRHGSLVSAAGKGQGVDHREHDRRMMEMLLRKTGGSPSALSLIGFLWPSSCCPHQYKWTLHPGWAVCCVFICWQRWRNSAFGICSFFLPGEDSVINVFSSGNLPAAFVQKTKSCGGRCTVHLSGVEGAVAREQSSYL